jgi:hypothetical protein
MLLSTRAPLTLRGTGSAALTTARIISVAAALYGGVVLLLGISTPDLAGELLWGREREGA